MTVDQPGQTRVWGAGPARGGRLSGLTASLTAPDLPPDTFTCGAVGVYEAGKYIISLFGWDLRRSQQETIRRTKSNA